MVENGRRDLSEMRPEGIVRDPKALEDIVEGDHGRVELEPHGLDVVALIAVSRVRVFAAGVDSLGPDDSIETADEALRVPEASSKRQCRRLHVGRVRVRQRLDGRLTQV